jgi:hypothetical protein
MPSFSSLNGIAFDSPEVRRFWRTYPRIRTLPERPIVVGGRDALLTRIENVAGTASIDVLFARDSFEMISIHGASNG